MDVTIRLSGLLASAAGYKRIVIEIGEGATTGEVFMTLGIPVSGDWVRISVNGVRISVNGVLRDRKHVLKDGDEILYFPVGGGG